MGTAQEPFGQKSLKQKGEFIGNLGDVNQPEIKAVLAVFLRLGRESIPVNQLLLLPPSPSLLLLHSICRLAVLPFFLWSPHQAFH